MSDDTLRMDSDTYPASSGPPSDHGRFVPGSFVGSRYRIVALLGKGGMGEVYRADDLLLGQPVALKFLPEGVAGDQQRLVRLLAEVRIARQISHPNVCRVYDVGEVNGEHFLSMEYVKGEDLGSLLHRIGRLAPDKGMQVARQICAGLAAAHDRGVLHRDLKPANVMIDERGVARITDFGLAALADSAQAHVREGTPAYMAPEQLEGGEVTPRSDIFALGLVLYEIFTGRVLFGAKTLGELLEQRRSTSAHSLRLSNDVDPAIERAIQRCLANDPQKRPGSAAAVAAALPGGDPLAAALAAGETPSPEIVAAAGERFGIEPRTALMLLGGTILLLAFALYGRLHVDLASRAGVTESPEAMAARARDVLGRVGHTAKPVDRAWQYRTDYEWLEKPRPKGEGSLLFFQYRDSPEPLRVVSFFRKEAYTSWPGDPTDDDPPMDVGGMTSVRMDPRGRLLRLEVVPPQQGTPPPSEVNWPVLLEAAGLDRQQLTAVAPARIVRPFDQRAAWTWRTTAGQWRAEAAALGGKPVYFEVIPPWHSNEPASAYTSRAVAVFLVIVIFVLGSIVILARRNLRLGRGDVRGATRLAAAMSLLCIVSWLIGGHHVASFWEGAVGLEALAWGALYAAMMGLGYLAVEPIMRRRRPQALVSWTRLISGHVRDPLVGRDILIGSFFACVDLAIFTAFLAFKDQPLTETRVGLPALNGANVLIADLLAVPTRAVFDVVMPLVLLLLFRTVFRKDLVAVIALGAVYLLGMSMAGGDLTIPAIIAFAFMMFVLLRFGFLAMAAINVVEGVMLIMPTLWPPQQWHTGLTVIGIAAVALIAGYGFVTALAGRPLFTGELLEA